MQTRNVEKAIKSVISHLMDRVMQRVLVTDPFLVDKHHAEKPLYAALVPDEIFKGSHFERRFVTPFGTAWEKLAVAVGTAYHGKCLQGAIIEGTIREESLRRIQEVLNRLEHRVSGEQQHKPSWSEEVDYVLSGGGQPIPVSVVCDILIKSNVTSKSYSFELKGPLPNSDQTKVSKEKMLKLLAMREKPVDEVYYALPYNPFGIREKYEWSFPNRWFDMRHDPCVLIGEELWDLIGGSGTYPMFVKEMNQIGVAYKERIYREYLGIEPPEGFEKYKLR